MNVDRRGFVLALALALTCGCGTSSDASPATTTPPQAPTKETPSAAPAAAPATRSAGAGSGSANPRPAPNPAPGTMPNGPPAHSPALAPEARARLREALRRGRHEAHAHHYDEAMHAMDEALSIDPKSHRLRCEAGYIAFLGGERDRATNLIQRALFGMRPSTSAHPEQRRSYAMCLYNAGLVYQADGRVEDARSAWQRSLALRPNATVERHLSELPTTAAPSGGLTLDPAASFEALARAVRDFYCGSDQSMLLATNDERCEDVTLQMTTPSGAGHGLEARLLKLQGVETHVLVLLLRAAGRVAAFDIAEVNNPGAFGIDNSAQISRYAFVDAMPGGLTEVRLDLHSQWQDSDMGGCEGTSEEHDRTFLCTAEGSLGCANLLVGKGSDSWTHAFDECEDDDDAEQDESRSYHLTLSMEGGLLRVSLNNRHRADPPTGLVGTHPFTAILESHAMAPLPTLQADR